MLAKQRVSKLSAAQRQLRTAVAMFFEGGDVVSLHTLVAASRQGLQTLLKQREGRRGTFAEHLEEHFTPEGQKIFRAALIEAEEFFENAERDPDRELEFNPETTVFMLVECAEDYARLTGRQLRELWVFMLWFSTEYPNALKPGLFLDAITEAKRQTEPEAHRDRRLFFHALNVPRVFPNMD